MAISLLVIYGLALGFILIYSIVQVHLAIVCIRHRKQMRLQPPPGSAAGRGAGLPHVTVQLPVYNEMYVVERLIDAVTALDYPSDRLEIQVLDDSTDETTEIIAQKVNEAKEQGTDIVHIRRENRTGFKAGALAEGLAVAKGEFIAIFDADFVPHPTFLLATLPFLEDPEIGMVQTPWEHINEDYSVLTRLQAFALDAHFSVEQLGRNSAGYFMNFNGTGGVWRKTCIVDAGGWQSDTLTEDLDLSYRAQLKGWKFKFTENLQSPAELPAVMGAIKSQQYRWTKGAAETARKNLWQVLTAKLPWMVKLHATFHLLNSMIFVCIVATALLSVPLVFLKTRSAELEPFFRYASLFMLSLLALILFFWVAQSNKVQLKGKFFRFALTFPVFLAMSMGLSLHNAIATIEGYAGRKTPFIRTPKFNLKDIKDNWKTRKKYLSGSISFVTVLEGIFVLYFGLGLGMGIYFGDYGMVPFHAMLLFGYGAIFFLSVRHSILPAR